MDDLTKALGEVFHPSPATISSKPTRFETLEKPFWEKVGGLGSTENVTIDNKYKIEARRVSRFPTAQYEILCILEKSGKGNILERSNRLYLGCDGKLTTFYDTTCQNFFTLEQAKEIVAKEGNRRVRDTLELLAEINKNAHSYAFRPRTPLLQSIILLPTFKPTRVDGPPRPPTAHEILNGVLKPLHVLCYGVGRTWGIPEGTKALFIQRLPGSLVDEQALVDRIMEEVNTNKDLWTIFKKEKIHNVIFDEHAAPNYLPTSSPTLEELLNQTLAPLNVTCISVDLDHAEITYNRNILRLVKLPGAVDDELALRGQISAAIRNSEYSQVKWCFGEGCVSQMLFCDIPKPQIMRKNQSPISKALEGLHL